MQDRNGERTQADVLAFLAAPAAHGLPPEATVERIDTHAAHVFLAGERAVKIKRAVRYEFLDFSTLDRRRAACRREIELNRVTAPDIYLRAAAITREADGTLALEGAGEPVEWAVIMRRFDAGATLDRVVDAHGPGPDLIDALAEATADMHRRAPPVPVGDADARLRRIADGNAGDLARDPDLREAAAPLAEATAAALRRLSGPIAARGRAGHVRRCHGDLHLGNVALIDGRPTIFDALEFDEELATIDVLYDLAFLAMDLWARGERAAANRLINRWVALRRDDDDVPGLALMPLFMSIRAAVRAKVAAMRAAAAGGDDGAAARAEASDRLAAARALLRPDAPRLLAVGGLSGTGKTTLAAALAPETGRAPGALHLRSDVERKAMADVAETERLAAAAYTPAASRQVYARLAEKAARALAAGVPVVVDAVFARSEERADVEAVARDAGAAFAGLWLEAPRDALVARVGARTGDASDADAAVVERQSGYDTGAIAWPRVDASGGPEATLAAARRVLEE